MLLNKINHSIVPALMIPGDGYAGKITNQLIL